MKWKVVGHWKEGESSKSKDYYSEKKAAAFAVERTGPGPRCRSRPTQGRPNFDLEKKFDQTKKEGLSSPTSRNAFGKKEPIVFRQTFSFRQPAHEQGRNRFTLHRARGAGSAVAVCVSGKALGRAWNRLAQLGPRSSCSKKSA